MAKKSMILKQQAPAKFSTRKYNRCKICGRPHAYLRNYGPQVQPLQDLRPPPRLSAQLRHLPYLLPRTGL